HSEYRKITSQCQSPGTLSACDPVSNMWTSRRWRRPHDPRRVPMAAFRCLQAADRGGTTAYPADRHSRSQVAPVLGLRLVWVGRSFGRKPPLQNARADRGSGTERSEPLTERTAVVGAEHSLPAPA